MFSRRKFLVGVSAVGWTPLLAGSARAEAADNAPSEKSSNPRTPTTIEVGGGTIEVGFAAEEFGQSQPAILDYKRRAGGGHLLRQIPRDAREGVRHASLG
jgi:hypothetical protein